MSFQQCVFLLQNRARCVAPILYGINMDFIGKAVEAVSGKKLDAYLKDHIFTLLGMNDTAFGLGRPSPMPSSPPLASGCAFCPSLSAARLEAWVDETGFPTRGI